MKTKINRRYDAITQLDEKSEKTSENHFHYL